MRDEEDDFLDFDDGPRFPRTVMIAGIAWICFGSLGLINVFLSLVLSAGTPAAARPARLGVADPDKTAYEAGQFCGRVFLGLISGVFIFVGVQTVRGAANDTLGNSIGSIIFGVFQLSLGVVWGVVGKRFIVAGVILLFALGLITAGILGLVGRKEYKAWRKEQKRRARNIEER